MSTDDKIMLALVKQVSKAIPSWGNERDVVTYISRPMWKAFLRAIRKPEDSEPTDWIGFDDTIRVYGSQTIVVDSEEYFSYSATRTIKNFLQEWSKKLFQ
jgi:hypothetical protein